jgi:TetR/AcrR family transcriptional regulator
VPARKRPTKTKLSILDAARVQFAHYGYAKVTMDEIAGEVGMGKASLYYYFPTKEDLFQAVMVHEHRGFMENIRAMLEHNISASEKIRAYVLQRFEYFNELLNLNILDFRSSVKTKPVLRDMFEDFARQELKLLQTIVREGRERGEFSVASIEQVAEALLHIMQGLRCRFLRRMEGPRIEAKQYKWLKQEQNFVTEIFLRGIQK